MESFGYSRMLTSQDFINIDTIPAISIKWNKSLPDSLQLQKEKALKIWLAKALKQDSILILK